MKEKEYEHRRTISLNLKMTPQEMKLIDEYRWYRHMTKSQFMRAALYEYIENHPAEGGDE